MKDDLLYVIFIRGRRDCVRSIVACFRIEVDKGFDMKIIEGQKPWVNNQPTVIIIFIATNNQIQNKEEHPR